MTARSTSSQPAKRPEGSSVVSVTLPRNLTPQQQLDALNRAQRQAEQRVRLGMQLFKSAEARLSAGQELVHQLREEQDALKAQMKEQVDKSIHSMTRDVDERTQSVEQRLDALTSKLEQAQHAWESSQQRVGEMMARCEAMLEQGRHLMLRASEIGQTRSAPPPHVTPTVNQRPDTNHQEPLDQSPPAQDQAPTTATDSPEFEQADDTPQSQMPSPERSEETKQMLNRLAVSLEPTQEVDSNGDSNGDSDATERPSENPVFSRIIDQLRETD